jgi:hypothetical protein
MLDCTQSGCVKSRIAAFLFTLQDGALTSLYHALLLCVLAVMSTDDEAISPMGDRVADLEQGVYINSSQLTELANRLDTLDASTAMMREEIHTLRRDVFQGQ